MGTLASKIAKASQIVGGSLAKDKTNTSDRYSYVSADQILSAAGQALAEVGVTIFPSVASSNVEVFERGQGKYRYDATVQFVFFIADDEGQMELMWPGYGSDYTVPDKAIYKAITSGHKYFLAKLLNIGAGNEDGEHESGNGASLAGRINESNKTCPCGAPPGKLHTNRCTATEAPTPATEQPAPVKPARKPAEPAVKATEPPPSVNSLDDVDELPFEEEDNPFADEPAGQPSSAGAVATISEPMLRKLQAQFTATFGGLNVDDARHWYIEKWTTKHTPGNVRTSANTVTDAEAELMIPELKKYTSGLRSAFETMAAEAQAENVPA